MKHGTLNKRSALVLGSSEVHPSFWNLYTETFPLKRNVPLNLVHPSFWNLDISVWIMLKDTQQFSCPLSDLWQTFASKMEYKWLDSVSFIFKVSSCSMITYTKATRWKNINKWNWKWFVIYSINRGFHMIANFHIDYWNLNHYQHHFCI